MSKLRFRASPVVAILALGAAAAAGVVAATQPSDEQALQPTRQPRTRAIESRVNDLLAQMTLEEKLEQIQLLPDFSGHRRRGANGLGSVLSVTDPQRIENCSRWPSSSRAEASRCSSPSTRSTASGRSFRSRWPQARASIRRWPPTTTRTARASRPSWGSSRPMPRWWTSRTNRAGAGSPRPPGARPYLNSVLAAARVKAIQGSDYSAPDKLVASPKHFAAYGQPEGGRDYNTTDLSEQRLLESHCRRSRRPSTPVQTRRCARSTRSTGVPGLRQRLLDEQDPQRRVELRRVRRERLDGGRRDARLSAEDIPTPGNAVTASPPTDRARQHLRSTPASTPR